MTPKIYLVAAVAGAALLLAAPAWGQDQLPVTYPDVVDRAVAQQEASTVSTYLDAHERAARVGGLESTTVNFPDVIERAVAARGTGGGLSGDDHVRIDPANLPTVAPTSSSSGREVEWPQIGIGFGIGILLALGLMLALRMTRIRQLAH